MNFDPKKSLFDLSIVRTTICVTILLAGMLAIVIAANTESRFSWTGEAFNYGITLFKVPIGMLAVGLTLVGIFGANHRSEQTKLQIERTLNQIELTNAQIKIVESQNKFSNFYKHIEEFIDYCDSHDGEKRYKRPRKLFDKIFAFSRQGDYSIGTNFLSEFDNFIRLAVECMQGFSKAAKYDDSLVDLTILRLNFVENYGLQDAPGVYDGVKRLREGKVYTIAGGNVRELIKSVLYIIESVDVALQFDIEYIPPASFEMVKFIEITLIPDTNLSNGPHHFDIKSIMQHAGYVRNTIASEIV